MLNAILPQIPEGHVLVFGGDAGIARQVHVDPFRRFLGRQEHKHKVITFGNMDHWVEDSKASAAAFPGMH
jgi:hypothetical protein